MERDISYRKKIELINESVDPETVFSHCGFNVGRGKITNPYRKDRNPSCYFKWHKGVLWFFDWGASFPGESTNENGITMYGAVKLYKNMGFGKSTNKQAIDYIVDTFIWGIADEERDKLKARLEAKKRNRPKEPVIEITYKKKDFGHDNYYTQYKLNKFILKNENVYDCTEYKIIKDGKDITGAFPTHKEANGVIIVYVYGEKVKFYTPLLKKGIRKPRFWGNIDAKNAIEGYQQIHKPQHKVMILVGSKKDYMTCRYTLKLKADIYSTQNEGMYLPDYVKKKLIMTYPKRFVMFDADKPGYEKGFRVMQKDEFTGQIILPQLFDGDRLLTDPSDLFLCVGKEKTNNIIRNATRIDFDPDWKDTTIDLIDEFPDIIY